MSQPNPSPQALKVVSFPGSGSRPKLLDLVRQGIRTRHYSRRTEEAYVGWIRRFIVFHGKRHPRELGEPEVTAFISSLAGRGVFRVWEEPAVHIISARLPTRHERRKYEET